MSEVRPGYQRPIFIIGCARSGTTLLQLMLQAHPRIAVPPETRHLIELYDRRHEFGDLNDPANVDRVVDWLTTRHRKRLQKDLRLDLDELRTRAHEVEPSVGAIGGLILGMYAERWGKPRWGDKRPAYFRRTDALLSMFPDAQLVHLIRDGRDCVSSLKTMRWWGSGSIGAMQNWVNAIRTGDRLRRRLAADQYYELHYEELVSEPRVTLRRLCEFLGEPFDEAMLVPRDVASEAVPKRKRQRHHQRLTTGVDTAAVGRWQGDLEPWELVLMEFVAARHLRRHGYELSLPRRRLPTPAALLRYARHRAAVTYQQTGSHVLRWWVGRRYRYPVAYHSAPVTGRASSAQDPGVSP